MPWEERKLDRQKKKSNGVPVPTKPICFGFAATHLKKKKKKEWFNTPWFWKKFQNAMSFQN